MGLNIAFIGLGAMGWHMASHLPKLGHSVWVWNRTQQKANEVRKGIVTSVHSAKAGHPGGSLSAADMFTFLYFEEMSIDP